MTVQHTVLENGLRIIAEPLPQARSVAFGFFIRTGARDETLAVSGVSHFLEHMVFKGTDRHSAEDVNRLFDEVGAQYNAATSEEVTLFYSAVLPEYFPSTFALQADILFPTLRDADFDTEKQVILEEIGMYDDQPSFVAYDHAMQRHFAGHPLGRIILGTKATVGALTASQMRQYHAERYRAGNMVMAVSGRFDWDDVVAQAKQCCGRWPVGETPRPCPPATPVMSREWIERPHLQQQLVVQFIPAPSATDPQRFAAELLSVIVGDDSNSRLYWDLVDPGHADAAELQFHEFEGAGAYLSFLAGEPDAAAANLERMLKVFDDVTRHGITADELELARNKVATRLVLRGERPMGRLSNLGHDWLIRHEYRSVADDLLLLAGLTVADLHAVIEQYPLSVVTTVGVGPLTM
ncbi:MAG: pitrilysin family protein [Planctomycetaceae bacterium]|nr:pitrilysin family protein [Planctomycetaceae bacterium]